MLRVVQFVLSIKHPFYDIQGYHAEDLCFDFLYGLASFCFVRSFQLLHEFVMVLSYLLASLAYVLIGLKGSW